ncbi:MAG TPA: hypothetical protein VNO52_18360 [Methylomirabilota bacterium]|nr:hypothetical protein [Methylomirabilota bacterium]
MGTLWIFLAGYAVLLLGSASFLSGTNFETVYAEGGVIESVSIAAWVTLGALVALGRHRLSKSTSAAALVLCLAAAAREADWHKSFTTASILKLSYYADAANPLAERVLVGAAVVAVACAGAILLSRGIRLLRSGGLRDPSARVLLAALGLLVATKVLDRAPAIIEETWPTQLSVAARRHTQALEEGLEAAIPMVFMYLVVPRRRRTVSEPRPAPQGCSPRRAENEGTARLFEGRAKTPPAE